MPSERVAIGEAIEREFSQRHGLNQHAKKVTEHFPAILKGRQPSDSKLSMQ